jgi:hypothetical protein
MPADQRLPEICWFTSANRASEPPSPRLSARMMMDTYFSVTITIIDQNIRLMMP